MEECKKELSDSYYCEHKFEFTLERHLPSFREEYEKITGVKVSKVGEDRCYAYWLHSYVFYNDKELLEHTINGKTRREWKLLSDVQKHEIMKDTGILRFTKLPEVLYKRYSHRAYDCHSVMASGGTTGAFFWTIFNPFPVSTSYLPHDAEIFVDRWRTTEWEEAPKKECAGKLDYLKEL